MYPTVASKVHASEGLPSLPRWSSCQERCTVLHCRINDAVPQCKPAAFERAEQVYRSCGSIHVSTAYSVLYSVFTGHLVPSRTLIDVDCRRLPALQRTVHCTLHRLAYCTLCEALGSDCFDLCATTTANATCADLRSRNVPRRYMYLC